MWELVFRLLVAHAFTDYVFQTEFMATAKDPASTYRRDKFGPWWWWALGHGVINGAGVYWATGNVWMGWAETYAHTLIDWWKCRGWISTQTDQLCHAGCKLLWLLTACCLGGTCHD